MRPTVLFAALLLAGTAEHAAAQQPLPQGQGAPNEEPSSTDQLLDRTDLGNVAQAARTNYHSGVRELEKAEKLLQKLAELEDLEKIEKTDKKLQGAAARAEKSFREALGYDADLIAAYAGLGTALRLQGQAEEALQVHAMGLRRSPDNLENFQGWAKALLDLNMLGNATTAYTDYLQSHPPRAEILMIEIKHWLAAKQSAPGELDPADLDRLATWISDQDPGASG